MQGGGYIARGAERGVRGSAGSGVGEECREGCRKGGGIQGVGEECREGCRQGCGEECRGDVGQGGGRVGVGRTSGSVQMVKGTFEVVPLGYIKGL